MKGKTIALTGASGLVGSHVAADLAAAGAQLKCGLRASSSLRWLQEVSMQRLPFALDEAQSFPDLVRGADLVVHCAAITRAARDAEFDLMNARAAVQLAETAMRAGVKRFVFVSSLAARGPDGGAGPDSPYGRSKLDAEIGLAELDGDMEVICLRLGGVYGPRDTDLLPLFEMASKGWVTLPPATQLLQPLYCEDAAAAIVAACDCALVQVPLAVCEPRQYSWNEVAEIMRVVLGRNLRTLHLPARLFETVALLSDGASKLIGRAPQLDLRRGRDLAVNTWTCDVSVAAEALGWQARVGLEEGLLRTLQWYRCEGWL